MTKKKKKKLFAHCVEKIKFKHNLWCLFGSETHDNSRIKSRRKFILCQNVLSFQYGEGIRFWLSIIRASGMKIQKTAFFP